MYLLVWLVVLIAIADVLASRQRRVVGGNSTSVMMFPYQVSIEQNGNYRCGGTIISANYILTVGHCVIDCLAKDLMIRVGSSYPENAGKLVAVSHTIVHENYMVNKKSYGLTTNDIALVKLKHDIIFIKNIQPIALYNSNEYVVDGQNATIIGWGALRYRGRYPLYLQSAVVQIIDKQTCNKAYKGLVGGLDVGNICAGYLGQGKVDACTGDSGGPLVIGDRQAGIISWGYYCASTLYPGVFVDITYYRDWIKDNSGV